MKQSTMFLENITVVDHAYVNEHGQVIGGSKHASFKVTGNIDPIENVVVDFSTIKKDLKGWVDDNEEGVDHKLWLIRGYSNYSIETTTESGIIKVVTPAMEAILPRNAVREIDGDGYNRYTLEKAFDQFLSEKLKLIVKTELTEIVFDRGVAAQFRYSHGLKNSTSWGCQNPCHGHLSFIQLADINGDVITSFELGYYSDLTTIASELYNTVFIWRDNIVFEDSDKITIKYTTPERGVFAVTYQKSKNYITILDTETTVEFLADYVAAKYKTVFERHGVHYVWVSEGLSKGAIAKV